MTQHNSTVTTDVRSVVLLRGHRSGPINSYVSQVNIATLHNAQRLSRGTLFTVVLRGTTVLPRHRGTIFLRYQYRRFYGTF